MLDNDLQALEFGLPETVNYVKQSAKIFCNYSVEENSVSHCGSSVVVGKADADGTTARPPIPMCESRSA
jgi:hypothetical protein